MTPKTAARSLSSSEAAIRSLRVLMTGYQLWGSHSRTEVDSLATILRMPQSDLRDVIRELVAAGLVRIDGRAQTVALTHAGVIELDLQPPSLMM